MRPWRCGAAQTARAPRSASSSAQARAKGARNVARYLAAPNNRTLQGHRIAVPRGGRRRIFTSFADCTACRARFRAKKRFAVKTLAVRQIVPA
jgi:hypothetical protein